MDNNSGPFLGLLSTVQAIDLSARKPEIAAAVTQAVHNFVTQTGNDTHQNDYYQLNNLDQSSAAQHGD